MSQREKLHYFLTLRQMETSCEALRAAYERLGEAIAVATGWDLRTVILDWLESELRSLPSSTEGANSSGPQLMKAAVAMSHVLTQ